MSEYFCFLHDLPLESGVLQNEIDKSITKNTFWPEAKLVLKHFDITNIELQKYDKVVHLKICTLIIDFSHNVLLEY